MNYLIEPAWKNRRDINDAVRADISLCYTCGTCVVECPVNRLTGRLHPRRIVWMANLGMTGELLRLAEIWYCLACSRCDDVCPMTVKPSRLIEHLRWRAVREGVVARSQVERLRALLRSFQRERTEKAEKLLNRRDGARVSVPDDKPLVPGVATTALRLELNEKTRLQLCFACAECSNACPVTYDRRLFDPLLIVRMSNLGREEALLSSPALWLCLQCRNCTRRCGQKVDVSGLIKALREMAIQKGTVPESFPARWHEQEVLSYEKWMKEVDEVLATP